MHPVQILLPGCTVPQALESRTPLSFVLSLSAEPTRTASVGKADLLTVVSPGTGKESARKASGSHPLSARATNWKPDEVNKLSFGKTSGHGVEVF